LRVDFKVKIAFCECIPPLRPRSSSADPSQRQGSQERRSDWHGTSYSKTAAVSGVASSNKSQARKGSSTSLALNWLLISTLSKKLYLNMMLALWLPGLFLLGLVAMCLCYLFMEGCEKI
jgi:hypothetical protein